MLDKIDIAPDNGRLLSGMVDLGDKLVAIIGGHRGVGLRNSERPPVMMRVHTLVEAAERRSGLT